MLVRVEKNTKKQIVVAVSPETKRKLMKIRHFLEDKTSKLWSLGKVIDFLCKEHEKK